MTAAAAPLQRLPAWVQRAAVTVEGTVANASLVVPTYRRGPDVVMLLDALVALPDPPGEVVVVDGSPDDDADERVAAWAAPRTLPFDLVVVRSEPGLTRQRNVGIDAAARDLVFYLDDDCLPLPGYFREIAAVFARDTDGRVGAVGGSIVNEMNLPLDARWRVRFMLGLVPRTLQPGQYYPTATSVPRSLTAPFSGTRRVDMVPGGAVAYRRVVLLAHRFSRFFEGYSQGEDLEMSLRIGRDWTLLWSGDAHVLHNHAPGGRPASAEKGRMEVRNRYFIWKRFSPDARWSDRCRFWLDIAYIGAYDVAASLARAGGLSSLRHAAGCARGALECLLDPPRHQEPAPDREYEIQAEERRGASADG